MTASDDVELSRRDIVRAGALATVSLAAASLPAPPALAADAPAISGVVFEDRSGTGRRQAGDRGIPGVLVSNGREVVRTDAGGPATKTRVMRSGSTTWRLAESTTVRP